MYLLLTTYQLGFLAFRSLLILDETLESNRYALTAVFQALHEVIHSIHPHQSTRVIVQFHFDRPRVVIVEILFLIEVLHFTKRLSLVSRGMVSIV